MLGVSNADSFALLKKVINFQTKTFNGKLFLLILHHYTGAGYFANAQQASFHCEYQKQSLFSIIPIVANAPYEFLLEYPSISNTKYNQWTQTTNPIKSSDAVGGYTTIHIDYPSGTGGIAFNGISLSSASSDCLIDGQSGHSNWWFGLGQYHAYEGGLTGPGQVTNEVKLWVKI